VKKHDVTIYKHDKLWLEISYGANLKAPTGGGYIHCRKSTLSICFKQQQNLIRHSTSHSRYSLESVAKHGKFKLDFQSVIPLVFKAATS
jgi:hypothetical protein